MRLNWRRLPGSFRNPVGGLLVSKWEPVFCRHVCVHSSLGTMAFTSFRISLWLWENEQFWCKSWYGQVQVLPVSIWTWGKGALHAWFTEAASARLLVGLVTWLWRLFWTWGLPWPPCPHPAAPLTHSTWFFLCTAKVIVHQNVFFIWDTKMQNCWDIKHFPISYNTATMYKRSDDKCAHI